MDVLRACFDFVVAAAIIMVTIPMMTVAFCYCLIADAVSAAWKRRFPPFTKPVEPIEPEDSGMKVDGGKVCCIMKPTARKKCIVAMILALLSVDASVAGERITRKMPDRYLVYVHSQNCPHCVQMMPHMKAIRAAGIPVYQVKQWEHPEWVRARNIRMFPTLLLIEHGRIKGRSHGYAETNWIREFWRAPR